MDYPVSEKYILFGGFSKFSTWANPITYWKDKHLKEQIFQGREMHSLSLHMFVKLTVCKHYANYIPIGNRFKWLKIKIVAHMKH